MKRLLTSAGVKNESIRQTLLELMGKPIAGCYALCIPTAGYGHPRGSAAGAWRFVSGQEPRCPMVELGKPNASDEAHRSGFALVSREERITAGITPQNRTDEIEDPRGLHRDFQLTPAKLI